MDDMSIKQTPNDFFLAAYGSRYYIWSNKEDFLEAMKPEINQGQVEVQLDTIDKSKATLVDHAGLLQAMTQGKVYSYIEDQQVVYIADNAGKTGSIDA